MSRISEVTLLMATVLSACAPSEQAVQTAIARVQAVHPTVILSSTAEPSPASSPTPSPTSDPRVKYEGDGGSRSLDNGEDPWAPVWDAYTAGRTYRPRDPREIITIDENYSVPAGKH